MFFKIMSCYITLYQTIYNFHFHFSSEKKLYATRLRKVFRSYLVHCLSRLGLDRKTFASYAIIPVYCNCCINYYYYLEFVTSQHQVTSLSDISVESNFEWHFQLNFEWHWTLNSIFSDIFNWISHYLWYFELKLMLSDILS